MWDKMEHGTKLDIGVGYGEVVEYQCGTWDRVRC